MVESLATLQLVSNGHSLPGRRKASRFRSRLSPSTDARTIVVRGVCAGLQIGCYGGSRRSGSVPLTPSECHELQGRAWAAH